MCRARNSERARFQLFEWHEATPGRLRQDRDRLGEPKECIPWSAHSCYAGEDSFREKCRHHSRFVREASPEREGWRRLPRKESVAWFGGERGCGGGSRLDLLESKGRVHIPTRKEAGGQMP